MTRDRFDGFYGRQTAFVQLLLQARGAWGSNRSRSVLFWRLACSDDDEKLSAYLRDEAKCMET